LGSGHRSYEPLTQSPPLLRSLWNRKSPLGKTSHLHFGRGFFPLFFFRLSDFRRLTLSTPSFSSLLRRALPREPHRRFFLWISGALPQPPLAMLFGDVAFFPPCFLYLGPSLRLANLSSGVGNVDESRVFEFTHSHASIHFAANSPPTHWLLIRFFCSSAFSLRFFPLFFNSCKLFFSTTASRPPSGASAN